MSDILTEAEQIAVAGNGPVVLPPATLRRVQGLLQQRNAVQAQINSTILIALEAMGVPEGSVVLGVDWQTGAVTLAEPPKE